jgi:hypothetical protein
MFYISSATWTYRVLKQLHWRVDGTLFVFKVTSRCTHAGIVSRLLPLGDSMSPYNVVGASARLARVVNLSDDKQPSDFPLPVVKHLITTMKLLGLNSM